MSAAALTVLALQAFGAIVLAGVLVWIAGHALRDSFDALDRFLEGRARRRELDHLRRLEAARADMAQMFNCKERY